MNKPTAVGRLITSLVIILALFGLASSRQLIIAHRGASGYLPEHTHEAKVASFIMGADFLEQDIVLTKDNVPIVSHDIYLDEVTNVADVFPDRKRASDSRYYVIDFTFAEIKTLKVSERFHHENRSEPFFPNRFPSWQSEFSVPSLEDEIELIKGMETSFENIYKLDKSGRLTHDLPVRRAGIYPEIKDPEFHRTEGRGNFSEIVLDILHKHGYRTKSDPVFVQCFDPFELRRIHDELKSQQRLIQLLPADYHRPSEIDWNSIKALEQIAEFADGIGPDFKLLFNLSAFIEKGKVEPTELYREAKRLKLMIHPYTLRIDQLPAGTDYETVLKIAFDELQVDGVFTDFPDLTLQYLKLKNGSYGHRMSNSVLILILIFISIALRKSDVLDL